jgi:1,2-dihydroxy-3-keto-5-methylthiopentene dioxygenase
MSLLRVYAENSLTTPEAIEEPAAIAASLNGIGVCFERWKADLEIPPDANQETILAAYREPVERLKILHGFQSADVISMRPDHPQKTEFRQKFLDEHTHDDFEVRFFVEGRGLFFLHPDDRVYAILCEQGDLISVPANVKHWFDMGENPNLKCIRLFTTPEGWEAKFTGTGIASRFPKLDAFIRESA